MTGTVVAGSYAAILRRPAVARTFGPVLVGRLAYGMLPLSLLFTIQHATGSFAQAATGMALNGLASLSMPLKARAIDRYGQRLIVPLITVTAVTALSAGAYLAESHATAGPTWWALGLAVGLASPPLGPCMRAQWRSLVSEKEIASAYSLDAVCEEALYLIGPMLAAGILAVAPAHLGLLIAVVLLGIGAAGLAVSPVAAHSREPRRQPWGRGPLRRRSLLGLLLIMAAAGAVTASIYTATAARALAVDHPEYAGFADAAVALGSVIGGLAWGRVLPAWRWTRSLTLLLTFLGGAIFLATLSTPFGVLAVVLGFAGLAISPIYVVAYRASDMLVRPHEVTEASTWVNTVTNLGISVGAATSGYLVSHTGARSPGWAGAALALALACAIAAVDVGTRERDISPD